MTTGSLDQSAAQTWRRVSARAPTWSGSFRRPPDREVHGPRSPFIDKGAVSSPRSEPKRPWTSSIRRAQDALMRSALAGVDIEIAM
jgi:hypothetical protein